MPRRPQVDQPDLLNKVFLKNDLVKRAGKEKWRQWATTGGFQNFTDRIAEYLSENYSIEVMRNTKMEEVSVLPDNRLRLSLNSADCHSNQTNVIDAVDHVMFAIPSHSLCEILRRSRSADAAQERKLRELASTLKQIRWVDVALSNVEFGSSPHVLLPNPGFGHLIPAVESSKALGIVYDSCSFPQHDRIGEPSTRVTCMMGGSWFPELFGSPDEVKTDTLDNAALESIGEQLRITQDPLLMQTTICKKCIPVYEVGHTDLVEGMEDQIEQHNLPFSLIGASYWGVSVNDCIFNSRIATYNMLLKRGLEVREFSR